MVATLQGAVDDKVAAAAVPKALALLAGDGMEQDFGLTIVKQVGANAEFTRRWS